MLDYLLGKIIICNDIRPSKLHFCHLIQFLTNEFCKLTSTRWFAYPHVNLLCDIFLSILCYGCPKTLEEPWQYNFLLRLRTLCSCVLEHKWPPGDLTCLWSRTVELSPMKWTLCVLLLTLIVKWSGGGSLWRCCQGKTIQQGRSTAILERLVNGWFQSMSLVFTYQLWQFH